MFSVYVLVSGASTLTLSVHSAPIVPVSQSLCCAVAETDRHCRNMTDPNILVIWHLRDDRHSYCDTGPNLASLHQMWCWFEWCKPIFNISNLLWRSHGRRKAENWTETQFKPEMQLWLWAFRKSITCLVLVSEHAGPWRQQNDGTPRHVKWEMRETALVGIEPHSTANI